MRGRLVRPSRRLPLAHGIRDGTELGLVGAGVQPEVAKNLDSAWEERMDSRQNLASESGLPGPTLVLRNAVQSRDEASLPPPVAGQL